MPPAPSNPNKRMTANPARPVSRYRPGKATHQEDSSDDDDEEEEDQVEVPQVKPQRKPAAPARAQRPKAATIQQPDDEEDDEEGFVTDEEDEGVDVKSTYAAKSTPATSIQNNASISGTSSQGQGQVTSRLKDEASSDEEEDSEEDSDEEDESSSSEDEAPQRKFQRPTFIKKTDRKATMGGSGVDTPENSSLKDGSQQPSSHANNDIISSTTAVEGEEWQRRRAQADLMIKDKLERDAIARAAGKKSWDDDDDLTPEQLVDDTDGLDPEAEHQAWKLRELRRLKRDREAIETREREIEEIERRRNLTAEERDREDEDFIAKQKAEREAGRSQTGYLAKYHHKGAFFQDDETAELTRQRDVMGARFEDDVLDKSTLPEYMRVRDMTKLGKKGRTRYTDLRGQDTGRFGDDVKRWRGAGDNSNFAKNGGDSFPGNGVDDRFLPDNDRPLRDDAGTKRTNTYRPRRSRSRSPRRREGEGQDSVSTYRPRRRSYSMSRSRTRSRSRSRSPPRRKRSPSPYSDRDKRRRLEV